MLLAGSASSYGFIRHSCSLSAQRRSEGDELVAQLVSEGGVLDEGFTANVGAGATSAPYALRGCALPTRGRRWCAQASVFGLAEGDERFRKQKCGGKRK
jgi:hypothetical protein